MEMEMEMERRCVMNRARVRTFIYGILQHPLVRMTFTMRIEENKRLIKKLI